MLSEDFVKKFESLFDIILKKIDFNGGQVEKKLQEGSVPAGVITVFWKRNVKLVLYIRQRGWSCYHVTRNDEQVSGSYYVSKFDENFLRSYQKFLNTVANGDFDLKKNFSDKVAEVVNQRNLTSYMNDTKWKEFLHVMTEEISLAVPYDYKTLFEEEPEQLRLGTAYDVESFNWYEFKSLEWVKVKPKFYEYNYIGKLVEPEKTYYDVEAEFLDWMDKYTIPYEYDEEDEVYVIYGYK